MRAIIKRKANDMIKNQAYVNNWFDADGFFDTEYLTGILKGRYFITCDHFMTGKIYAVRKITSESIDSVLAPVDTLEECKQFIKGIK